VKYLLDKGAEVNKVSWVSFTPLLQVCHALYAFSIKAVPGEYKIYRNVNIPNLLKIVDLLLERGASMDFFDQSGWNALMKAVDAKNYDLFSLLLEKGNPSLLCLYNTRVRLSIKEIEFSTLLDKKISFLEGELEAPQMMTMGSNPGYISYNHPTSLGRGVIGLQKCKTS
jgi:ankyrin repeat protein